MRVSTFTQQSGREETIIGQQVVDGFMVVTTEVIDKLSAQDIMQRMQSIQNQKLQIQQQIGQLNNAITQMDSDYSTLNDMLNNLTATSEQA